MKTPSATSIVTGRGRPSSIQPAVAASGPATPREVSGPEEPGWDAPPPRSLIPVPPSARKVVTRARAQAGSVLEVAPALSLSPRMTAIFGGLFGLATVTTIIALLIQAAPPRDERSQAASAAASASAAHASATAPPVSKKRVRTKIPGPWRISDLEKDPSVKIVSDTIDGRSFVTALTDKGVQKDQIYRILKAFESVRKFDKTSKKDRFIVAIDRQSQAVKAFEYVVSPLEIFQAKDDGGTLGAQQLDMKIADAEVTGSVYVGKNLDRSIEDAGLEPALGKAIDEAFAGRMSVESIEEGSTIRVIAVETTALGEFAKYKKVIAIEVKPPDPSAAAVRAYSYDGARAHGYFDEKGRQPDGAGWGLPVPGAPITSHFNPKRLNPVLHKVMPHNGTDFGAPSGTPIYAAFKGKISHYGPAGPCGNMAQIDHPGGIQTGYCHMSKFAAGLKIGSAVGTKQLIGYIGTTGRSTGPHLHFYAKKDGVFFDAETLHMNGLRVLPSEERDAFAAAKTLLDARIDAIALPEAPPAPAPDAKADRGDDKGAGGAKAEAGKSDDAKGRDAKGDDTAKGGDGDDDRSADKPSKSGGSDKSDKPDKSSKGSHASTNHGVSDDEGEDLVGADLGGK